MHAFLLLFALALGCERPVVAEAPPAVPAAPEVPPADEAPLVFHEVLTGGASAGDTLPLVIAVHGRGDKPENFARVLASWPVPARVVFPQAILPYANGGWSWFNVRVTSPPAQIAAEVGDAADQVAALTRWLCEQHTCEVKPAITGFSQGGMISYTAAVRHPDLYSGAIPVSGFLPESILPELSSATGATVPIRALHGDADTVIDPALARRSLAALEAAGLDATLTEYPGVQHSISKDMRAELDVTLRAFLTP